MSASDASHAKATTEFQTLTIVAGSAAIGATLEVALGTVKRYVRSKTLPVGVEERQLREAMRFLAKAVVIKEPATAVPIVTVMDELREAAGERSQKARAALLNELVATMPDAVSSASLDQAKREAAHRARLLRTPTHTYESLQQLRGDRTVDATRTAVSRWRNTHQLFTVPVNGQTVIPGFLLTDQGRPRAELAPLLDVLMPRQIGPWQLWTWLTSATGQLSGGVPADYAADPATHARALAAADRLAAQITPADKVSA